jgi:hypothetical protein
VVLFHGEEDQRVRTTGPAGGVRGAEEDCDDVCAA